MHVLVIKVAIVWVTFSFCAYAKLSLSEHEKSIIRDIVDDISEDGENYDFDLDDEDQFNRSSSQYIPSDRQSEHNQGLVFGI